MSKPKKPDNAAKTLRPRRDREFLRLPRYEGGMEALRAFIDANLVYPQTAMDEGIEGDVHVKYDVAESGQVIDARVLRGIGGGCDEEALRLVRMLSFTPVRNRGQRVTSHFEIILHFRLPVSAGHRVPVAPQLHISYSFVPESADADRPPIPEPTSTPVVQSANVKIVYTWTGRS